MNEEQMRARIAELEIEIREADDRVTDAREERTKITQEKYTLEQQLKREMLGKAFAGWLGPQFEEWLAERGYEKSLGGSAFTKNDGKIRIHLWIGDGKKGAEFSVSGPFGRIKDVPGILAELSDARKEMRG